MRGGGHIGASAPHVLNLIWFGYIARKSQGEERVNFLVQMISSGLATRRGKGDEVGTLWILLLILSYTENLHRKTHSLNVH
jgi:hypothetical protein